MPIATRTARGSPSVVPVSGAALTARSTSPQTISDTASFA